jgi:WASH complex subunit strumpellin
LRLVSRGSSIIAELLRLSDYIPPAFRNDPPADARIYSSVISDFTYLKNVDAYESTIYEN